VRSAARVSVLLLPALLLACKIATIRPIEADDDGGGATELDVEARVEALWSDDLPAAIDRAVDLGELLRAAAADPEAVGARWGRREGRGPFNVLVSGGGRVLEVDTSSRVGTAVVEVATLDGPEPIRLQIGPVLRGTSIRDALPTVSFDQFVNQIQYADVATALNARVETGVLQSLDRASLVGKEVRFVGATTLEADGPLTITPVRLEMGEAP
jgi:predicted lipoprotein